MPQTEYSTIYPTISGRIWRLPRAQALKGEAVVKSARLALASRRVPACDAVIIGIQMERDQDRTGDSRLVFIAL